VYKRQHLSLLVEDKGEEKAIKEIKKFVAGYTKNLKGARRFRDEMMKIKNLQTLKEMFYNFLREV